MIESVICDPNFEGLALGCIDADFCNQILVGKLLTRTTNSAFFFSFLFSSFLFSLSFFFLQERAPRRDALSSRLRSETRKKRIPTFTHGLIFQNVTKCSTFSRNFIENLPIFYKKAEFWRHETAKKVIVRITYRTSCTQTYCTFGKVTPRVKNSRNTSLTIIH